MLALLILSAGLTAAEPPPVPVLAYKAGQNAMAGERSAEARSSRALTDDELHPHRGGQTLLVTNQTLAAILSGNQIGDYQAGAVALGDQALSNFNGLGNFVINTGAQNNLQAGMNVTINLRRD